MIYTFYSYKGGVGRSMALANLAEWFSWQGLNVVMVDWDLEAPGLESFFFDGAREAGALEAVRSSPGLIDLLVTYQRQFPTLPLGVAARPAPVPAAAAVSGDATPPPGVQFANAPPSPPGDGGAGARGLEKKTVLKALEEYLPPLSAMLYPIRPGTGPTPDGRAGEGARGTIKLLTAGWRDRERFKAYAQQVQTFDWSGFYAHFQGEAFFEWMRGQLERLADVILIDSRTGVTEMGGVCTRQLADVVVSFCAPNDQNLTGATRMADSFQSDATRDARAAISRKPLEVVVVPTRVDLTGEIRDLNQFEARFKAEVTSRPESFRAADASLWDLKIPYVTKYSYREQLVMGPADRAEAAEVIVNAYKTLAAHLAYLAPETGPLRTKLAAEIRRVFRTAPPRVAVVRSASDCEATADELLSLLRSSKIDFVEVRGEATGPDIPWPQVASLIDQAEHLVLVPTAASLAASQARRLWDYARQQGKTVTLVATSAIAMPVWSSGAVCMDPVRNRADLVKRLSQPGRTARVPQLAPEVPETAVPRTRVMVELKRRLLASAQGKKEPDAVALVGLGGTGKSVLAAQVCHDDHVIAAFPGGILWATLGPNPEDHLEQLARLYQALTGESLKFTDRVEAAGRLQKELSGRRCLTVLDDVRDVRHLRPFVKGDLGVQLILTRDRSVPDALGISPIEIGTMEDREGRAMIAGPVNMSPDDPSVGRLAQALEYLPLAIRLALGVIRRRLDQGSSPEEAIAAVTAAVERRGIVAFDQVGPAGQGLSVARTVEATLALLTPEDRRRFNRLWAIAPDATDLTTLAKLWALGEPEAESLVDRFAGLGLLQYDMNARRVDLHPVIRAYLDSQHAQVKREPARDSSRTGAKREHIEQAGRILRGESARPREVLALAKHLKAGRQFSLARGVLARALEEVESGRDRSRDDSLRLTIAQQLAFCTYMDPNLISDEKFDRALEILDEADDLATTRNQETLGLAGSVYKRRWQVDGQKGNLERSASFYLRGFREGSETDQGYTGINAAFVLDLLASLEAQEERGPGAPSESVVARRNEARRIRAQLAEVLSNLPNRKGFERYEADWWFLVTVAEAYFGLGRDDEAAYWLNDAGALPADDWQYESVARQLAAIARLREEVDPAAAEPAWQVISRFLGGDAAALRSAAVGKVGLALSGGGFRASLFHIGVLARLAELDALRGIEVLSCVSGGSIIGAHYYLEVRQLLRSKPDHDIKREDYIEIVRRIEREFLDGVQRNIRTRLIANPWKALKRLLAADGSRTRDAGDLFETELYARVQDGEGAAPRWLNDLRIQPRGGPEGFTPKSDNWRRSAKVPVLVLNATTLNTGHNWQFTASWMGEPPSGIDPEVDGNDRLRRMYYHDAPYPYRKFRLGHAVAASACVPGVFEPLAMSGLYPDRVVRLVDGGVYDNQGIGGLLDEECSVLLVSDASGQMQALSDPSAEPLDVPLRASSILQARVRSAQYRELRARMRGSLLRGLMLLHLKKDLDVQPVDWLGCDQPTPAPYPAALTAYGVPKSVQQRLASIRTDLDSFCDQEAYALMLDGYRMARHEFPRGVQGFPEAPSESGWAFLSVDRVMIEPRGLERPHYLLLRLLDVASHRFLKPFRLPGLTRARSGFAALIAGLGLATLFYAVVGGFSAFVYPLDLVRSAFLIVAVNIVVGLVLRLSREKTWPEAILGPWEVLFGWAVAGLFLIVFDRWYLNFWRVETGDPPARS